MSRSVLGDEPVSLLLKLLEIPGTSGLEKPVLNEVLKDALAAGLPQDAYHFDQAHVKAKNGECGNLIITLPGTKRGPRRLLMAHVDTVPLCLDAKPKLGGDFIFSESDKTALGGDDRSGTAVILSTLLRILREKPETPPLTFLFTVQEEIGLVGARHVSKSKLGDPKLCFNFDGGPPNLVITGATGDVHIDIVIHGVASHAGARPEMGVSAVVIAGMAIADLQQNGWLGLIEKPDGNGTSNLGFINGGAATNVVTDYIEIRGEARSHDPEFRQKIVDAIEAAFTKAAADLTNQEGRAGSIEYTHRLKYEAFRLNEDEPAVTAAAAAITATGLEPVEKISNGGLDANWITSHGLPTVTLGCGQEHIHTVAERLHVPSFHQACEIAWRLATDTE
ncbi:M20/M25/M40 family metallo-hydrolase [Rubinisphaera sp. JC750]|uniref:M20/M25/M40 family metallo-hydrolase n=1 Tax=Rubinisphaera sp. JC750 TaxID=2898658 RepID=UPI001F436654|nr:M20/M25/M40 family metallo-hydrolase [Rubinisphaera sp. JC750]